MIDLTYLSKAIEVGRERIFASFIVNSRYRAACEALAEHLLEQQLPHILEALAAQAEVDHNNADDMSGYQAEAAFHAAEWLRDKAKELG